MLLPTWTRKWQKSWHFQKMEKSCICTKNPIFSINLKMENPWHFGPLSPRVDLGTFGHILGLYRREWIWQHSSPLGIVDFLCMAFRPWSSLMRSKKRSARGSLGIVDFSLVHAKKRSARGSWISTFGTRVSAKLQNITSFTCARDSWSWSHNACRQK